MADTMVELVKTLGAKTDLLCWISGTNTAEGENQLLQLVL